MPRAKVLDSLHPFQSATNLPPAPSPFSPACLKHSRNAEEPEIRDDHFAIVIENIFGLEVFVQDALGMKVAHALQEANRDEGGCQGPGIHAPQRGLQE